MVSASFQVRSEHRRSRPTRDTATNISDEPRIAIRMVRVGRMLVRKISTISVVQNGHWRVNSIAVTPQFEHIP